MMNLELVDVVLTTTKNEKHNNVKLKTCRDICNTLLKKNDILISLELLTTMFVSKNK